MATKQSNLALDRAHFNYVRQHIPGYTPGYNRCIEWMLDLGIIQVSTAVEHAVAQQTGTRVISEDARDLSDGSDVKTCTARTHNSGRSYGAPVTNIQGKTGSLRVQVYERLQDRFYLFLIPREAYQHIPPGSNIEIPFESDGTPRRSNHWWQHEVLSWAQRPSTSRCTSPRSIV